MGLYHTPECDSTFNSAFYSAITTGDDWPTMKATQ